MLRDLRQDLFDAHSVTLVIRVGRVAVRAAQVTTAGSHENRRESCVRGFTLNAEEDLVDLNGFGEGRVGCHIRAKVLLHRQI